jgi:hypothetical protein
VLIGVSVLLLTEPHPNGPGTLISSGGGGVGSPAASESSLVGCTFSLLSLGLAMVEL